MKTTAEYLIVGGGVVGLSTAYNLAKKGAKDVVLIDQKYVGFGGSTRNGSGHRAQYARKERVIMGRECTKLWEHLDEELDGKTGWTQTGYIYALYDEDWIPRYKEFAKMHNEMGVETKVISAEEVKEIIPLFNTEGVYAACYNPKDGKFSPFGVVTAYFRAIKRLGVEVYQYCPMTGGKELPNGDWEIETPQGTITAHNLIVTAGSWSRLVGEKIGIKVPVVPYVEEAMITEPVAPHTIEPLLNLKTPKYNDFWLTQTNINNGIIFGHGHMQWASEDKMSWEFTTSQEYAQINCWNLYRAFPSFGDVKIVRHFSGFYDVTPDREPIMSRVGDRNLYFGLACAAMHAPICGQAMAELILDGKATCIPLDFCAFDRFEKGACEPIPY